MDKVKLKELKEHGHYYSVPKGVSMFPMLKNAESIVDIVPCESKLKKYDVALFYDKYRHKCVLHRVLDVKNSYYIFYGDNCWSKEIVPFDAVIGVASQFKRDSQSEWISVNDKRYLLYVHLWCGFLPVRRLFLWLKSRLSKVKQSKAARYMLYLIASEINGLKPELSKLSKIDFQDLYDICKYHNLTNIVYAALKNAYGDNLPDTGVMRTWREDADKAIVKNIMLESEHKELFSWFEKNCIWHLPLKGVILKDLYPKIGMREMADVDVLFDKEYSQNIKEWFKKRGYDYCKGVAHDEHESYYKTPVYNFELHPKLFSVGGYPTLAAYYDDVRNKLLLDEGKQYRYHFSDEDFYIYFIAHTYKHFISGGTGFRSMLDCYVFCNAKYNLLDHSYIEKELNTLGILEFEQKFRGIALKVFSKTLDFKVKTLSKDEQKLLEYFLLSGTYGTKEHFVKNMVAKKLKSWTTDEKSASYNIKLRYIINKLFPNKYSMGRWCKVHAPIFLKYKRLMPLSYIYRILTKDVTMFKWVTELKVVLSTKTCNKVVTQKTLCK